LSGGLRYSKVYTLKKLEDLDDNMKDRADLTVSIVEKAENKEWEEREKDERREREIRRRKLAGPHVAG
jgi:hypothetical protein